MILSIIFINIEIIIIREWTKMIVIRERYMQEIFLLMLQIMICMLFLIHLEKQSQSKYQKIMLKSKLGDLHLLNLMKERTHHLQQIIMIKLNLWKGLLKLEDLDLLILNQIIMDQFGKRINGYKKFNKKKLTINNILLNNNKKIELKDYLSLKMWRNQRIKSQQFILRKIIDNILIIYFINFTQLKNKIDEYN